MPSADDSFVELASQMRAEVEAAMETGGDVDAAFDRVRDDERRRVARAVFDRLGPDRQWEVLAAVFDDAVLRDALDAIHQARRLELARTQAARQAADQARIRRRVDLRDLPAEVVVTLGLFRPVDVRDALRAGPASTSCARWLLVRTTDHADVHVLDDVFNPEHGLYVTPEYDESVWATERLASHARVALGSGGSGGFEPVLYLGGRVDTDRRHGRLHLGWLRFDDVPVVTDPA